jgi:hypothetical protein
MVNAVGVRIALGRVVGMSDFRRHRSRQTLYTRSVGAVSAFSDTNFNNSEVLHPHGLLSVGVGDLTDKCGPAHVHGRVNLASLRSRIILEDFHHQGCVVRHNNTRL